MKGTKTANLTLHHETHKENPVTCSHLCFRHQSEQELFFSIKCTKALCCCHKWSSELHLCPSLLIPHRDNTWTLYFNPQTSARSFPLNLLSSSEISSTQTVSLFWPQHRYFTKQCYYLAKMNCTFWSY